MAEVQSCPDVNQLQRLLDGLLTDEEQAGLNDHLAECSACQERLDGLIAGQGLWSDVARNLKSAHAEIEAGTATRYAPRPGEALDHADDDLTLEFLAPSDKPDSLGRLGHYEVLEVIGRGGMGIVLRAFDEKLHRVVAIKVMAPRLAATSPPRKRFLREARAAAQVRHENVVDIHAVEEQPIPHLVMEFVPGESLQQRLDRIGPLEVPDVLRIGQQIARGLAAAHAQGLIHRDVKPGNVLLEKGIEERVKITDFGLARAADDASMTQSGIIAGTPLYMAPEQAQGGAIDHRADLFSFGSVLYTMASGRPPFRAPTSLSVLKRVVEDTPRPIREIIPEVPQWLCDIIARLHAKRPEDRFPSAKEVADLLGRCQQEHEQHGQVAALPHPSPVKSAETNLRKSQIRHPKSQIHFRPWPLVAAAAVLLLAISLTEATGVTRVTATVIRLLTPDGTLVVETNDPDVKVTVEGDGGLIITGAGLEEIRLRPGSYRVHADKAGQRIPLDQELVTITRGDKQVVRVRMEGIAPAAVASPIGHGAFVVLGMKGVEVGEYNTLGEAVLGSSDGDTIEIRGNGPFAINPITIRRAIAIRAGHGFRPVITLGAAGARADAYMLRGEAPLLLEGLEFQRLDDVPQLEGEPWQVILDSVHPLYVANCRLLARGVNTCIGGDLPTCELRNCEFLIDTPTSALSNLLTARQRLRIHNCVHTGAVSIAIWHVGKSDISIELTRNTFRTPGEAFKVYYKADPTAVDRDQAPTKKEVRVEAKGNVFDAYSALVVGQDPPGSILPDEIERQLTRVFSWQGEHNLFAVDSYLTLMVHWKQKREFEIAIRDLADWRAFWDASESGSVQGRGVYQGVNFAAKAKQSPKLITPADFRLHKDCGGYRAGPDGKDLGADIDLIGPGEAYERWKKTPEYQEWLKDSGQTK